MTVPPVIQEWARTRGIAVQPRTRDGRVAFNVDDAYRVYVYPAPDNRLLVEARVTDLPTDTEARERLVLEALQSATGRIRDRRERLVADAAETALLLQCEAAADDGVEAFNETLGDFINHLAAWRTQLQS